MCELCDNEELRRVQKNKAVRRFYYSIIKQALQVNK